MTALQTQLPIRAQGLTCLLDAHCARAMAGLNEDEALALARMDWGFDISSGEAKSMDLRLHPATVENYLRTGGTKRLDWDWSQIAETLTRGAVKGSYAGGREIEFIYGTVAQRILNCSSTHLNSFLRIQLKLVPGTTWTSGPNGTPQITVDSFLEFLRKRRVR